MGGRMRGQQMSPKLGIHLQSWAAENAAGFMPSEVFKEYCEEVLRKEINPSKFSVLCPFDDEHSNAGAEDDQGCYIEDAGEAEQFQFRCSHDSCAGRDRLTMLEKAMNDDWFPDEALTDSRFSCLVVEEEEPEETTEDAEPTKATQADVVRALTAANNAKPGMKTEDVKELLKSLTTMDQFDRQRVMKALATNLKVTTEQLASVYRTVDAAVATKLPERFAFLKSMGVKVSADGSTFMTGDEPISQSFEIDGHFEDGDGDNATLFLRFEAMGQWKVAAVEKADLYGYGNTGIQALAAKNFRIDDELTLSGLLKRLRPPVNGRWVSRRGWHGNAFLTIGGQTIAEEGATTPSLRMRQTTRPDFGPMGTLEGWKKATEPVWANNAKGREQMALGMMLGFAGPAYSKAQPQGALMLSMHGPSSRGKSLTQKLLASVAGPPTSEGTYFALLATTNGLEAQMPDVSGHGIGLDDGEHMAGEDVKDLVFMLEHGEGKIAANADRAAKAVRRFGSLILMVNEHPWVQKLRDEKVKVTPGFDARVVDINIASVDDYPAKKATTLTTQLYGVERHNGHALPMIVRELLSFTPERLNKIAKRLVLRLVGANALGIETRSMEVLAWVWIGGLLGKRLGLIPQEFDVRRVIEWARDNRVADSAKPVSERVLAALRSSIARRRKIDLYKWETFDPDAFGTPVLGDDVERVNRPLAGYFYKARDGEELIVLADSLRDLADRITSETEIAQILRDAGYLRKSGKNLFHDKLPRRDGSSEQVKNYRIVSSLYLSADAESASDGAEGIDTA